MPVGRTSVSGRCAGRGGMDHRAISGRERRFWRWNDDLDCIAKTRREQISGRGAVIGPIRQKSRNRPVELIQKPGQGRAIADVVQRQIRADDLAGCEVQAEV